jgi:hypothetical protein
MTLKSPSRDGDSRPAGQEIPSSIIWNPKVDYPVHKIPPLDLTFSQMKNLVHILTPYFFKISFNIISHLRLDFTSGCFPSGCPNRTYTQ